jgi:hypothetical protein
MARTRPQQPTEPTTAPVARPLESLIAAAIRAAADIARARRAADGGR